MQVMIEKHLEMALNEFSQGDYYSSLIAAKDLYFTKTGKIFDVDNDFEIKMRAFNEWYLFHYKLPSGNTPLNEYIKKYSLQESLGNIFSSMIFSVYEFLGTSFFKKQVVIRDLYSNKKFKISPESKIPLFLNNDIFVARLLCHNDETFLLSGLIIVPQGTKRVITRKIKLLRKKNDHAATLDFIYRIIYLKNKASQYKHVKAQKIFDFKT